jgi:hypothetical protein
MTPVVAGVEMEENGVEMEENDDHMFDGVEDDAVWDLQY